MDFLKKNKVIVGVLVMILILAGVWFFVLGKNGASGGVSPLGNETENVKQLTPEDIGLELSLSADKQTVEMTVSKLEGVKTIEYEISYDAEETNEGETASVPKGVIGSPIDISGESEIKREITLGTCSASKCRYDKVTSDIKFVVKVSYSDGEVGAVEATVPFE